MIIDVLGIEVNRQLEEQQWADFFHSCSPPLCVSCFRPDHLQSAPQLALDTFDTRSVPWVFSFDWVGDFDYSDCSVTVTCA